MFNVTTLVVGEPLLQSEVFYSSLVFPIINISSQQL